MTEITRACEAKMFTTWPFMEKVCGPLIWGRFLTLILHENHCAEF